MSGEVPGISWPVTVYRKDGELHLADPTVCAVPGADAVELFWPASELTVNGKRVAEWFEAACFWHTRFLLEQDRRDLAAAPPTKETYTREQLLSCEFIEAQVASLMDTRPSPPEGEGLDVVRQDVREANEAALDAIDKGKGGRDV